MVRDANVKQVVAEKALKESQMKVDVLTAEVTALKTLVLTSTPSMPNPHLHPQIDSSKVRDEGTTYILTLIHSLYLDIIFFTGVVFFSKKHRRCPSHFNLKYGRENSPPDSPEKEINPLLATLNNVESRDGLEVGAACRFEEIYNTKKLI